MKKKKKNETLGFQSSHSSSTDRRSSIHNPTTPHWRFISVLITTAERVKETQGMMSKVSLQIRSELAR